MSNRLAIFGDIHGDLARLQLALGDPRLTGRRMIFVGDYINRGPKSREVVELLIEAQRKNPDWVFLEGNHEAMLLGLRDHDLSAGSFIRAGGSATALSYAKQDRISIDSMLAEIPCHHWRFFESLGSYWESPELTVAHAGIPRAPSPWSREDVLFGGNEWLFQMSESIPIRVVFGHYVQRSGKPFLTDQVACIDTGCGSGGPLTVLLFPEWKCIQF